MRINPKKMPLNGRIMSIFCAINGDNTETGLHTLIAYEKIEEELDRLINAGSIQEERANR